MRMIVDKNVIELQSEHRPLLDEFLCESNENYGILIDYFGMESYGGNPLINAYYTFSGLLGVAERFLILKPTSAMADLDLNKPLLQQMIDLDQTRGLKVACQTAVDIHKGKYPNTKVVGHGKSAAEHFEKLRKSAGDIKLAVKGLEDQIDKQTLKLLRTGGPLPLKTGLLFIREIKGLVQECITNYPGGLIYPINQLMPRSFIFRYAVSNFSLVYYWLLQGGVDGVNEEKLFNDKVDILYSTYATYFDGLLTADERMKKIFSHTNFLVNDFLGPRIVDGSIDFSLKC